MAILEWDESFSVGDEGVDLNHQSLFNLLNKLYDSLQSADTNLVIDQTLTALHKHTCQHFATEESLMIRIGFQGLDLHKAFHAQLARQVADLKHRFAAGEPNIAQELIPFLLGDWLLEHVSGMDREYAHTLCQQRAN